MLDELTKKQALSDFKKDFNSAENSKSQIMEKIREWRNTYNGELYGNEVDGRSKMISRDIKKQSEWQQAELLDPFVSTPDIVKANPVTFEDAEIAPRIEILLNTQFCRQFNRYNFMAKALRVLDVEGTCVIRLGWEYEAKDVKVRVIDKKPNPQYTQAMSIMQELIAKGDQERASQLQEALKGVPEIIDIPRIETQRKAVKNHPTAQVCRNEDIFIDPTCLDDMDKCQFIVYRFESDLNSLKKANMYDNLELLENKSSNIGSYGSYSKSDITFEFNDKSRKKFLVHEYWGFYDINGDGITEPIVCTWVDDVCIRFEENPFPDKALPFLVVPFMPVPFRMYGESNAELLGDIQKVKTAIYRGFIDNMALSNNAQKGIRKGALDRRNLEKFLKGENFEFNGTPNDFYDGHFNELPGSIFNMVQMLSNEAESITGVKSFNQGMTSSSLGGTATGVQGVLTSASTRRLNIVRNIAENLVKPLLRKWLAYSAEFLDEETQIRITNEEFLWLKRDDLGANIDIDLNISTSDDNQAKAQELAFILQTTAQSLPFDLTKQLLVKMASLYRLPDLAKAISTYEQPEPQPDPLQQQLMQLQAENLAAEAALTRSKAVENQADMALKEAKTESEKAKAANIASRTDKQDLDYVQQYDQTKNKIQATENEKARNFELSKEMLKLLQGTKREYL